MCENHKETLVVVDGTAFSQSADPKYLFSLCVRRQVIWELAQSRLDFVVLPKGLVIVGGSRKRLDHNRTAVLRIASWKEISCGKWRVVPSKVNNKTSVDGRDNYLSFAMTYEEDKLLPAGTCTSYPIGSSARDLATVSRPQVHRTRPENGGTRPQQFQFTYGVRCVCMNEEN
ncbi:hypothetical protein EMPG_16854 [Blastomyces silverae]|uniref:Uncharacterized protein n=1 Tax=Blastomyces silverae TaxID=2060906 RepID=A0A0H1B995_9EURO|nr:hypothetical protein EMPG_16854 [Blastomyces silverae]